MKTMITFRHMKPSSAIKDLINQKLERLEKYGHADKEVHVILATEKHHHLAEVVLNTKKFQATGKASTSDMYASIDEAIQKVEKSLRRNKEKQVKSRHVQTP